MAAAVTAQPAATVAVLRPAAGGSGFEVLMLRRSRAASFLADLFVFPGGRVEPSDQEGQGDAFARAAARELAEEASITVAAETLVPFAHWITPSAEPKRFDTRFFLAPLADPAQVAQADTHETTETLWGTPTALLDQHARSAIKLAPPTVQTLADLAAHTTIEGALVWARAAQVVPILPKMIGVGDALYVVLPWDPEYAALEGEGHPVEPPAPALGRPVPNRYLLKEGHWHAA